MKKKIAHQKYLEFLTSDDSINNNCDKQLEKYVIHSRLSVQQSQIKTKKLLNTIDL